LLVDSPDSAQTYFWLANVGVNNDIGIHAALDLVNTLFGGRFHVDAEYGAAHQIRLVLQRARWLLPRIVAGEFAIPFVHRHREHPQGARSVTRYAHGLKDERCDGLRCSIPRAPTVRVSTRSASKPASDWPRRSRELEF